MKKLKMIHINKGTMTLSMPEPLNDGDTLTIKLKDGMAIQTISPHDRLISEWRKRRGRG